MRKLFSNLKDNRYFPFIIIGIVVFVLIILNIVTSHTNKVYDKEDITFYFDAENSNAGTEVVSEDNTEVEEVYNTEEEDTTDYEDVEDTTENIEEPSTITGDDLDAEDEPDSEPKLFATKEFLENTALAFFEKNTRYKKYFVSDDLFNSWDVYLNDPKLVSSDLKKNTVTLNGYADGDDNSRHNITVELVVENNKVVDIKVV